ncbi:restriction endonuclease subunit S [Xylella fastidiosa subsp. multiplex]
MNPFIEMADLPEVERDVSGIGSRIFNGGGSKFKNGDTLFSRITPCLENGKTAKVGGLPNNAVGHGSTEFIVMAAKDSSDEDFVYYVARHPEFRAYAQGRMEGTSGRQRVSWQAIADYEIPDFSSLERNRIGSVLSSIDNLIANNRRVNQVLEAMARALFKAWCVDFEPVRAKLEGRWQRGESLPGLPAHLYDLFPDRLIESELGEIPEGWAAGSLRDLASLNPESWTKNNSPDEILYVDLANTKWGTIEQTTKYSWNAAPSRAQRVLRPGDTLVGTVRPGNGSYSYVSSDGLTGSTGFGVLRPKFPENREMVYLAATSRENIERLAHQADGGAYPAIRPEKVIETVLVIPLPSLIAAFSELVSPMLTIIEQNKLESRSLAQLRDTLLPKLISGELRVPDAERITGATL